MSEFDKYLWVEKYRPKTVDECILPTRLKKELKGLIKGGQIPSLMLIGPAGCGKTSVAKALCDELDSDWIMINGSENGGIDTVRTEIRQFASTVSLMSDAAHKVVILDEADGISRGGQAALRAGIEEFSDTCRFIFTCNFKNRIIDPIHSRCSVVDFSFSTEERKEMKSYFFMRLCDILEKESIEYDKKVVAQLVDSRFPDFRSILNELQRYSSGGVIDVGILNLTDTEVIKEIARFIKAKDFPTMRKWIDENESIDSSSLFNKMYEDMMPLMKNSESKGNLILILDEYQDKATRVVNQKINLAACMVQMMGSLVFA